MKLRTLPTLLLCIIVIGSLASGCALTVDRVQLDYVPQVGVQLIDSDGAITVAVAVDDVRSRKDRVSSKKNGYGMEMAAIESISDVAELVRQAVSTELAARGFQVAESREVVKVEVQKFYCDFKIGFFAGDAVAEVTLNAQVQRPDGLIAYSRVIAGEGLEPNIQLCNGTNAKAALDRALQDAMTKLFGDPAFLEAVSKSGTT
jgi:uncharacterized lipoprotein YajG